MDAPVRALYLDIQAAQEAKDYERGIPRYAAMHAAALAECPGAVRRLAMSPFAGPPRGLPAAHQASPLLCWNTAGELERARREGPLAYHFMSPLHVAPTLDASFPFAALAPDDALVVTMYDAVPLLEPREYMRSRAMTVSLKSRYNVIRSADLVLTLARYGVKELVDLLDLDPERVAWIGGGVDPFFSPVPEGRTRPGPEVAAIPSLRRPFVMALTHHYERKNTETLLHAFALLPAAVREEVQLVLVGNLVEEWRERYQDTAVRLGLTADEVVFTGRVTDDVLRDLYRRARLFIAPSLSEGFGLPVAEAIACGCPAITSNTSALPEVLEFPPSTFDPRDPVSLATLIERVLVDAPFEQELRAVGALRTAEHRWPVVAERTLAAVARIEAMQRRRQWRPAHTRPRRLRLAVAGRIDPAGTAEDGYGAEVVAHLAARADVDLFVPDHAAAATRPSGVAGRFPMGALGSTCNAHAYHAVIHVLGADGIESRDHLAAAARAPGMLWLHDVRLALPAPAPPRPAGELVPPDHRPGPHPRLLAAARVVLVNSHADHRLVELGRALPGVPVERVELGVGAARPAPPAGRPTVALVLAGEPDGARADAWLEALLDPDAFGSGAYATLCGPRAALARFAGSHRLVSAQPIIDLIAAEEHGAFKAALRSAALVVDATIDPCAATMAARTALSARRRVVSHRLALSELGAAYVRRFEDGDDPFAVLHEELAAAAPPPYPTSVVSVAEHLLDLVDRRFVGGRAA